MGVSLETRQGASEVPFGPPDSKEIAKLVRAEEGRILGRDFGKYWTIFFSLRGYRALDSRRGLVTQAAYYSLRFIDDAIDGDMYATDPKAFAQDLGEQIRTSQWKKDQPVSGMIRYATEGLQEIDPQADVKGEFLTVINAMAFDDDRAKEKKVLSRSDLKKYYWNTFAPGFNLFFIGTGSKMKIQEIEELPYAMARLNSVRDLREDWEHGLINIPGETLRAAGLSSDSTFDEVENNSLVQLWIQHECREAKKDLRTVAHKLNDKNPGTITEMALNGIMRRLRKFANSKITKEETIISSEEFQQLIEGPVKLESILGRRELQRLDSQELLTPDEIKQEIDDRLQTWYSSRIESAQALSPQFQKLVERMREFITRGGKRMRPLITYITYLGYGGEESAKALDVATSLEILHNALLIHDDILDGANERYDGPNIAGTYQDDFRDLPKDKASKTANDMALLAGDLNLAYAFDLPLNVDIDDKVKKRILSLMAETIAVEIAGEQMDVLNTLRSEEITLEEIIDTYRYKTVQYTALLPMQLGLILALQSEDEVEVEFIDREKELIESFADSFGIAYQLVDDYLDWYGEDGEINKPKFGDYKEGKMTPMILFAIQMANDGGKDYLKEHLGDPNLDEEVLVKVLNILEESSAKDKFEELMKETIRETLTGLGNLQMLDIAKKELESLIRKTFKSVI